MHMSYKKITLQREFNKSNALPHTMLSFVRSLTLSSLSQQLSSACSGRQGRPQRTAESCRLTVHGRYNMLVFVGNVFSLRGIQIWNRYIDINLIAWVHIYADSDCKVLTVSVSVGKQFELRAPVVNKIPPISSDHRRYASPARISPFSHSPKPTFPFWVLFV